MRHDMPERFMEPGRGSRIRKYPRNTKTLKFTDDDGQVPTIYGMRKVYRAHGHYGDGCVGTDFALLRRFLQSRVGQPWNDVYSEICAEADKRSFKGHHFMDWLEESVDKHCVIDDEGVLRTSEGYKIGGYRFKLFYVHPISLTLEASETGKFYKPEKPTKKVFELDGKLYHKNDDMWYRVEMTEIKERKENGYVKYDIVHVNDAFSSELTLPWEWGFERSLKNKYGVSPKGKCWYCNKKESANSKEIERLKKKYNIEED